MEQLMLQDEQKENQRKKLDRIETQYIRARRIKLTRGTFISISVIGRGSFGEVCMVVLWLLLVVILFCLTHYCCLTNLVLFCFVLFCLFVCFCFVLWTTKVRLVSMKGTKKLYAMKKLNKSKMIERNQVKLFLVVVCFFFAINCNVC